MRHVVHRRLLFAGALLLSVFMLIPPLLVYATFPKEIRVLPGQWLDLDVGPLFTLTPQGGDAALDLNESLSEVGEYLVELRLFGRLPVGAATVQVVPEVHVVPGGQAIGILLSSEGLVVTRTIPVASVGGRHVSPAAEAGIQAGDVILQVGATTLQHPAELDALVASYGQRGQEMPLVVRRGGKELVIEVQPVMANDPHGRNSRYMLGLYLKDPAAGVGTLTFWDPVRNVYGALGHKVEDEAALGSQEGRIVAAHIHGIHPGTRGRPGEKLGIFEGGAPLGTIERNTPVGIFGHIGDVPWASGDSVPVALGREVEEGAATMLTVVEGGRVERFDIRIVSVQRQSRPDGKGLVIEVTDPRLLERTNGIVQGMSGSPILQNGKLVGAVTHVFINDPARGYGVLAEWMVYEAGIGAIAERAAATHFIAS